jgi:antitoxin YefM
MPATEHVSLAEVKNRLSEVVERLEREHGRVVITKHGRPAAVMLSLEDLESLEETLEILSDPDLMKALAEADDDFAARRTTPLSKEEALRLAKSR